MGRHGELLGQVPDSEDLDVDRDLADQSLGLERLGRSFAAREALVERAKVDRLRVGANGPIGIASAACCRAAWMRMSIGIWPPSNPAGSLCEPARDFWPLIPRPE